MKTLTTQFYLVALVFLIVIALCIPAVPEETKAQLRPWLYPLLIMINPKQGTGADIFPAQKNCLLHRQTEEDIGTNRNC